MVRHCLENFEGCCKADGGVSDDRGVGALCFPRRDDAKGVEPRVLDLHVGAGPVGEVYVAPKSFAVQVVGLSVGVVGVVWVASEPARRRAGSSGT